MLRRLRSLSLIQTILATSALTIALAVVPIATSSCGSLIPVATQQVGVSKQQAVAALQIAQQALGLAQDELMALCQPNPQAPNTCRSGLIADQRYQQIQGYLAKAFGAQMKLATVLKTWRSGSPQPTEVNALQDEVTTAKTLAEAIAPSSGAISLVNRLKTALDNVMRIASYFQGSR